MAGAMTVSQTLSKDKTSSVLGRGLAEMAKDNVQPPTNLTAPKTETKSLSELKMEIKFHLGQMAGHAVEIGKLLIQAKEQVNHGEFGNWLENNFNLKVRMAQNFMAIAERFSNTQSIAHLGTTQMIAMLALPAGEEENFIAEKISEGKDVSEMTIKNLREEIKNYKEKISEISQERDGYKRANEIADGQLETTGAENENLRKTLTEANRKIDSFVEENLNLREEKEALQEKVDDLQNEILQKKTETVEVAPADYEPMKKELADVKAELKNLQEKPVEVAVEYPADYDSIKIELAELKDKQKNLQAEYSVSKKISEMFSATQILLNYTNLIEVVKNMAENDSSFGEKISNLGLIQIELKNCFEIWREKNVT